MDEIQRNMHQLENSHSKKYTQDSKTINQYLSLTQSRKPCVTVSIGYGGRSVLYFPLLHTRKKSSQFPSILTHHQVHQNDGERKPKRVGAGEGLSLSLSHRFLCGGQVCSCRSIFFFFYFFRACLPAMPRAV